MNNLSHRCCCRIAEIDRSSGAIFRRRVTGRYPLGPAVAKQRALLLAADVVHTLRRFKLSTTLTPEQTGDLEACLKSL